jgi:hypothetical protein
LVTVLERVRSEEFLQTSDGWPGRPPADRTAIARAFVAKQIDNMPTTGSLLDRLQADRQLRRLCGWERTCDIPKEWTFARAFGQFAASRLPQRIHEALISKSDEPPIIGHISRDATASAAREKPARKPAPQAGPSEPQKRGRPKKGESRPKEPTRFQR